MKIPEVGDRVRYFLHRSDVEEDSNGRGRSNLLQEALRQNIEYLKKSPLKSPLHEGVVKKVKTDHGLRFFIIQNSKTSKMEEIPGYLISENLSKLARKIARSIFSREDAPEPKRDLNVDYQFKAKNIRPLAKILWSLSVSMGHLTSAASRFFKMKSVNISPDGVLGGKGYARSIKNLRKDLYDAEELLSSIVDTIHDEVNAPHWKAVIKKLPPKKKKEVEEEISEAEDIMKNPGKIEKKEDDYFDSLSDKSSEGGSDDEEEAEPGFEDYIDTDASGLPTDTSSHNTPAPKKKKSSSMQERIATSVCVEELAGPRVRFYGYDVVQPQGPEGSWNDDEANAAPFDHLRGDDYDYPNDWQNDFNENFATDLYERSKKIKLFLVTGNVKEASKHLTSFRSDLRKLNTSLQAQRVASGFLRFAGRGEAGPLARPYGESTDVNDFGLGWDYKHQDFTTPKGISDESEWFDQFHNPGPESGLPHGTGPMKGRTDRTRSDYPYSWDHYEDWEVQGADKANLPGPDFGLPYPWVPSDGIHSGLPWYGAYAVPEPGTSLPQGSGSIRGAPDYTRSGWGYDVGLGINHWDDDVESGVGSHPPSGGSRSVESRQADSIVPGLGGPARSDYYVQQRWTGMGNVSESWPSESPPAPYDISEDEEESELIFNPLKESTAELPGVKKNEVMNDPNSTLHRNQWDGDMLNDLEDEATSPFTEAPWIQGDPKKQYHP